MLNGEIRVKSTFGEGSSFVVNLPITRNAKEQITFVEEPVRTERNEAVNDHAQEGLLQVLVIEDSSTDFVFIWLLMPKEKPLYINMTSTPLGMNLVLTR